MPHVTIKIWPGPSKEQKTHLTEAVVRDVMSALKVSEDSISVAIEEIAQQEWVQKVYRAEIEPKMDGLFKKPGYSPA